MRRFGGQSWLWLILLVLLLVASTRYSLALVMRDDAPRTALELAPDNARVLAAVSASAFESASPSPAAQKEASRLAVRALLREPGNVSAIATLGMLAALDRKPDKARAYFNYSATRSRRDLRTRLWLIEDAVARQNVAAALTHYDIALRTSKTAPEILFPILTSATSDGEIRAGLAGLLRKAPPWREAFEGYLANNVRDFPAAAALFTMMVRGGMRPSASAENILLTNMVAAGQIDGAWQYYLLRNPRSGATQPRNATFSPERSDGSPFDWSLVNDNGISSALGNDTGGGALSFEVTRSLAGAVTQQLQRLPAGRYRLSGHSRVSQAEAAGYVRWEVVCTDGRTLGSADVRPSKDDAAEPFTAAFDVPAVNCGSQLLRLIVLPNDSSEGISGEMLDIRFDKVSTQ
jgi:hypothetical protein